jgi:hypothetical protein
VYGTVRSGTVLFEQLNSCVIRKHQGDKVSQDKTLHTPKINAVIRVHDIGIPKLEVPLCHCQAAVPQ